MNPFDQKPTKSLEDMMLDWKDLSPRPYKKLETDPYTKARIILMNGIEVEAVMFGHNFNRNCEDNDLRPHAPHRGRSAEARELAVALRRDTA